MAKCDDFAEGVSAPPATPPLVTRTRAGAIASGVALAVACSSSGGDTYGGQGGASGNMGAGGQVAPMIPPAGMPPMPASGGTGGIIAPMIPPFGGEGGMAGEPGGGAGDANDGGIGGIIPPMPPPMPAP